jgi:hypothetical protein
VVLAAFLSEKHEHLKLGGVVALLSYNIIEENHINRAE